MSEKESDAPGYGNEMKRLCTEVERLRKDLANKEASIGELVDRDQLYQEMIHRANSIILLWEPDGTIIFLNDFGLQFFGYDSSEIVGANIVGTLIAASDFSDRDLIAMIEDIGRNAEKYRNNENENMTKDGRRVWVAWTNKLLENLDQYNKLVLSVGNDITARKQAEDNLATFHRFIESSGQGFGLASLDGTIHYVNPALCRMLGKTTDQEVLGESIFDFYPEEGRENIRRNVMPLVLQEDQWIGELELITHKGASLPTLTSIFLVTNDKGEPNFFAQIITDITEQKKFEDELRRIATIDGLTGVFNRRHFLEMANRQIKLEQRYRRNLAVLMIDIDHFKLINDSYGHAAGDAALQTMAGACRRVIRETEIFGRLGGEEFGILLIGANQDQAVMVAERIRRVVSEIEMISEKGPIRLTVSIGVAGDASCSDVESMLKIADQAMYKAKDLGRDRVCCTA